MGESGVEKPRDPDRDDRALRREVVLLLDDIQARRDPKAYREEQLPRLRQLVSRFKKTTDG